MASAHPTAAQVLAVAVVALLARLPFAAAPLTPDEGGFLMVAAQWARGTSLYGNYWVDRPPLIIGLFQIADLAGGGPIALRALGALGVAVAVVLAGRVGHLVARLSGAGTELRRLAVMYAAVAAGLFLVCPLFGTNEVDGELLAMPFVMAGIVAVLEAHTRAGRWSLACWGAAGALTVAAAAVKQDMLEAGVVAAVVLAATVRRRPRDAAAAALVLVAGALAAVGVLLVWAGSHGTTPMGLWDAVVTFRSDASAVIAHSAPGSAQHRAIGVSTAFVTSGAIGLVLLALVIAARRGGAGRLPVAATLSVILWELFAVAAGGSYWLHYLVGTVPGLVLAVATAAVAGTARRRAAAAVLAYAAFMTVTSLAVVASMPVHPRRAADLEIEHYLETHAGPHDTGVVAFGNAVLLQSAGLQSPYPELWSLPVRVRDPRLTQFTDVLSGPTRPTWVVVDGTGVKTWGVDASQAQPVLDREYRQVHSAGDWHVFHLRPAYR